MPEPASRSSLQGVVAFAGRLASMKPGEAFALIEAEGGTPRRGVTKDTGLLIVGELGWPLVVDGQPSKALRTAKALGLPIVSERRFLEWIGRAVSDEPTKSYSAEQLAGHSGLPLEAVEQVSLYGLLNPDDGLYGFRDLAAARQLRDLIAAGVSPSTISKNLREIRKWLPDAGLASVKLVPKAAGDLLVAQLGGLATGKGQFVLDVDDTKDDPDQLFEQAEAAEEAGDLDAAERLYRRIVKIDTSDVATGFNLADLLKRRGRLVDAEATYRACVRDDPGFAEAWYNLADLLDDQGRLDAAIDCLVKAVAAEPDYADAIFNLARLQQRKGRLLDAAQNWRRYLALDADSPWAAQARKALKLCEMIGQASA